MRIMSLRGGGQYQLKHSIVNVENNLDLVAEAIPRPIDDTSTILIRFMRRQHYQRPYIFATVRPFRIHRAGRYLVNTPLYRENNIRFNETWKNSQVGKY